MEFVSTPGAWKKPGRGRGLPRLERGTASDRSFDIDLSRSDGVGTKLGAHVHCVAYNECLHLLYEAVLELVSDLLCNESLGRDAD